MKYLKKSKLKTGVTASFIAASLMSIPAYADLSISSGNVEGVFSNTVSMIINASSVIVAIIGCISLIPGIVHYVQSFQSSNPEQKSQAGVSIAIGIALIAVAVLIGTQVEGIILGLFGMS